MLGTGELIRFLIWLIQELKSKTRSAKVEHRDFGDVSRGSLNKTCERGKE